ncbi:MAG: tRNA uridine-5-carboxymethylaminomethyl(34) synthesis enzyme MnmG [Peptoniphilus sp.]|nr:tRNA uridine-5-carboxymethylaminomethyl(34) synthesis enzyme MnmG [Peptoniphilus sp.]MDY3118310.1 tRNA uridine-5-carboxymethylaminomethyl(34) synthesis enzyme MnmG [Peptoniphilus sp.]
MNFLAKDVDIVVVGAGHAGCEAALAAARMGHKVVILTINLNAVAAMNCNPNVGGTGKGHLVREIDALGGEIGRNIDKTFIQSRMLNRSKGPAVHSLRAQADKWDYHTAMKQTLENTKNLFLVQDEAVAFNLEEGQVAGVITKSGAIYRSKKTILATGTYLRGRVFMGEVNFPSGPDGMQPANALTSAIEDLGIETMRMKTGTPARVHRDSINFSGMDVQKGDAHIVPFSFSNFDVDYSDKKQIDCYLTYTTPECHEIIRENIHRSAMAMGDIEGTGPRYCPSIEDKVTRFADRDRHQVFLEPEGLHTKEIYVQGVSSSLPVEVQMALYHKIDGLENCEFMRPAYAIEYDAIDATKLRLSLQVTDSPNLYMAGQINGSSGYEEAAAQGLMAGINAALAIEGKEPLILGRDQAYIGVLIDDLVTKGTREPYRMMTARAEYRLTLRQDNADLRLTEIGRAVGLVGDEQYEKFIARRDAIEGERARLSSIQINPTQENSNILNGMGSAILKNATSLLNLMQRPELTYESLAVFDPDRPKLPRHVIEEVETDIRYKGYIEKQAAQIQKFRKMENKLLPKDLDYASIGGLRNEAKEKLNKIKPESVGQAGRISGVSPADINVLLIYLEQKHREEANGLADA